MKRLFSVIVLVAVLVSPLDVNAQEAEWGYNDKMDWVILTYPTSDPVLEAPSDGTSGTLFEYTAAHKPPGKEGDFGLFPFLGKSFYRFVLKPAYIATKASGLTGGKAVKFFFVQVGHFLF